MKRIDSEFAFQARELDGQIEGILGDPPNHKNYRMVLDALLVEYTKNAIVEDVNLLSFALVDHLRFNNLQGLLASAKKYDAENPAEQISMATCDNSDYTNMLAAIAKTHPDLTRKAIIVAFLHKNRGLWLNEDDAPQADDEDNEEDSHDDNGTPTSEMVGLFDTLGDDNAG